MVASIEKFRRICGSGVLPWLLIANCAIFIVVWITVMTGNYFGLPGNFTMEWLCVSASATEALRHGWTALTYMAVHYDFLHLLFNMLWLFWFGRIVLTTLSDRHLLWLYIGGGVAGAVLYIAVQALWPGLSPSAAYLCGASASVLSVMSASAVRTPGLPLYLFLFGEVRLKWVALGCIVLTFAGIGGGNAGGQAAHVGGVLFGIVFALSVGKKAVPTAGRSGGTVRRRAVLKVTPPPRRRNVVRDGNAVARAASGRLSDSARLDALLDKIRLSGYRSLTDTERKELNALSQRLQNDVRQTDDR